MATLQKGRPRSGAPLVGARVQAGCYVLRSRIGCRLWELRQRVEQALMLKQIELGRGDYPSIAA